LTYWRSGSSQNRLRHVEIRDAGRVLCNGVNASVCVSGFIASNTSAHLDVVDLTVADAWPDSIALVAEGEAFIRFDACGVLDLDGGYALDEDPPESCMLP
jgi:hypothetical protein